MNITTHPVLDLKVTSIPQRVPYFSTYEICPDALMMPCVFVVIATSTPAHSAS
jgi:hypothetical protein